MWTCNNQEKGKLDSVMEKHRVAYMGKDLWFRLIEQWNSGQGALGNKKLGNKILGYRLAQ